MIGDVIKAKRKLKNLVGAEIVKKLSARVQKAEAQNWTANSVVNNVKAVIGKDVFAKLLEKSDVLVEVMKLLSTKPHTTSNSNYLRYVYNDQFVACLKKVHGDKMLSDEEIKELDEIKDKLEKYIKREGEDFKDRKHKDVSEKMQSLREVNRLKVTMTALTINLIDYAEDLDETDETNKKEEAKKKKEKEEREERERQAYQERTSSAARDARIAAEVVQIREERKKEEKEDKEKLEEIEKKVQRNEKLTDDDYEVLFIGVSLTGNDDIYAKVVGQIERFELSGDLCKKLAKHRPAPLASRFKLIAEARKKTKEITTFVIPNGQGGVLRAAKLGFKGFPNVKVVDEKGNEY